MATFQLSYKAKGDAAAQYCGGVRNTMRVAASKEKKKMYGNVHSRCEGSICFQFKARGGRYVPQWIPFIFVSSSETLPS